MKRSTLLFWSSCAAVVLAGIAKVAILDRFGGTPSD